MGSSEKGRLSVHAAGRAKRRPGSPGAPQDALPNPGWRGDRMFCETVLLGAVSTPAWTGGPYPVLRRLRLRPQFAV